MKKKLSPKQQELLARAMLGEDRQLPERFDPGPPPFMRPALHWVVPPGCLVPNGSSEYTAARVLKRRGLLKAGGPPQGGYSITARGRKMLVAPEEA